MRFLKFFNSNRISKVRNKSNKLIRFITFIILILIFANIIIYFYTVNRETNVQLQKSNNSNIEQVAITFEIMLKNIKGLVYQTSTYDTALLKLINEHQTTISYKQQLSEKLSASIFSNEYMDSAYLYLPQYNEVYSTRLGEVLPLEAFPDKKVFNLISNKRFYSLDPRKVQFVTDKNLLISFVATIPLSGESTKGIIVINVDASKLYLDILKKIKAENNMNFYIYNSENKIIISKDESLLLSDISSIQKKVLNPFTFFYNNINKFVVSDFHSKELEWNFVLQTKIAGNNNILSNVYSFFTLIILIMLLLVPLILLIAKFYTHPINKLLLGYNEKLLIDFITDSQAIALDTKIIMLENSIPLSDDIYGIMLFHTKDISAFNSNIIDSFINIIKHQENSNIRLITLAINRNTLIVLAALKKEDMYLKLENTLENSVKNLLFAQQQEALQSITISLSQIKNDFSQLPTAYKECLEALEYKISFNTKPIHYTEIQNKPHTFQYPYEKERQLINNLLLGNADSAGIFLDDFITFMSSDEQYLKDSEIIQTIYQLQTSILRSISGLPIPIKITQVPDFTNSNSLENIKDELHFFLKQILDEINKTDESNQPRLVVELIEHIEKNYMKEEFNLNKAADDLNMNRNYLSKLVKEKTGDSFNDYVTKRRMLLAKELLRDKSLSIDEIALKVGFHYSNYFIKVFKSIEGITPGQYRSTPLNQP